MKNMTTNQNDPFGRWCHCGHSEWSHHSFTHSCMVKECICDRFNHDYCQDEPMSHVEPEHNRPDEWQGGGTDRRRNPERVKELEKQLAEEREAGVKVYLQLTLLEKKLVVERERYEKLRMETTSQVTGQSEKGNDSAANRDSDSFSDSRTVIKSYSAEALAAERDEHRKTEEVQHAVIKQLREQLAAAIVAIKRMQGAATDEDLTEIQEIADAALAKIGAK
jgi:hypothetical protein